MAEIAGMAGVVGAAGAVVVVVVAGVCGAVAGRLGRGLLASLRRGVRPPPGWCEVAVAVLWAVVAARFGTGAPAPGRAVLALLLGWWGSLLAVCDLRAHRLPDALTLPACPVAAVALAALAWWARAPAPLSGGLAGAVVFAGCYAVVRLLAPGSLGAGDVKLAAGLGAVVGAVSVPAVVLCVLAAALLALGGAAVTRRRALPHGPCMIAPTWLVTALLPVVAR